ncbi:MAG TPA: hypothetical protein VND21_12255 [Planctomycetota bacterium]|nr:hypothetical protein [Planctomycetota bacterium]
MNPADDRGPALPLRREHPWLSALVAAALVAFVAGLFVQPDRAWPAFLQSVLLLAGMGLSGALFLAIHHVVRARWSVPVLPAASSLTSALPAAGALVLLLGVGASTLYPWADPAVVEGDHVLEARRAWMTTPFVIGRAAVAFAVWIAFAAALVRRARAPREGGSVGLAAAFLVVFAFTFSLVTFDLAMSLERWWFSTIFAVYHFSGAWLSGLAALAIVVVLARRSGRAPGVDDEVLHDLGKLLFGFSLFWAYIWFSQYMLIWYTNNPEETSYYLSRHGRGWAALSAANVLLNWTVPFALLMPRAMKRRENVLLLAATVILVGRWLDLYLGVFPALQPDGPTPGVYEYLLPLGALALLVLLVRRTYGRAPEPLRAPDALPAGRTAGTA